MEDQNTINENVVTESVEEVKTSLDTILEQQDVPTEGFMDHGDLPVVRDDSELGVFLSRPVNIGSYTWTVGSPLNVRIDPWTTYLSDPAVADKVRYYSRLRGTLVIRVNISGTPFHYGLARLTYRMHPGMVSTDDPVYNLSVSTNLANPLESQKMVHSQMSGIYFNPCYNDSVQLRCPYVHFRPGAELAFGTVDDIGTLEIVTYANLRHANAGTNPVHLEVFAHMENLTLDVPTAFAQGFSLSDAKSKFPVSFAAGTFALKLAEEYIPYVSDMNISQRLGLSRPITNEPTDPVNQIPFNLSNYDSPDTSCRLALSAASEVSIDGRDLGTDGADELLVESMASRESYILGTDWSSADVKGTFKAGMVVTPCMWLGQIYSKPAIGAETFGAELACTPIPAAFLTKLAQYWKCDMVYRVTVVASPYHKGRLRVYYDPRPTHVTGVSPPYNLVNSVIINLAEESEAELRVPWQNVRDACQTTYMGRGTFSTTEATFASESALFSGEDCNGRVVVEVLNDLVAPTDFSNVHVIVSARAENLALYSPTLSSDTGLLPALDYDAVPIDPYAYDVSGGETIVSLRQLMKRYTLAARLMDETLLDAVTYAYKGQVSEYLYPQLLPPRSHEDDVRALNLVPGSSTVRANLTGWTFYRYLSLAFALMRGSVRWKVSTTFSNSGEMGISNTAVVRSNASYDDFRTSGAYCAFQDRQKCSGMGVTGGLPNNSIAGMALETQATYETGGQLVPTSNRVSGFVDVEFPFQSQYRALNPRARPTAGVAGTDTMNALISVSTGVANTASWFNHTIYSAGGEDLNMFGFQHAPTLLVTLPKVL